MFVSRVQSVAVFAGAAFLLASCGNSSSPKAEKEKEIPVVTASASALPSGSAASLPLSPPEKPKPKDPPALVPQRLDVDASGPFQLEGAVGVVSAKKVGRLVGDKVEWLDKQLPEDESNRVALGGSTIRGLSGRWPDAVDVYYTSNQGRALRPTVYPLTGKGAAHTAGSGGGLGDIVGTAMYNGSAIVVSVSPQQGGVEFVTTRGPGQVIQPQTPEKAGCENKRTYFSNAPAIVPDVVASTKAGTLLSLGGLCDHDHPALEVWDQPGKSRIIDLTTWIKKTGYGAKILQGKGDEAWIFTRGAQPILHYINGKVEALPIALKDPTNAFASPGGVLYVTDGITINRWDESKWTEVGHLNWKETFYYVTVDDEGTILISCGGICKLVEGPSVAITESCTTPFVYMYEVSYDNDANFTFPTTRKALATFEGVSDLGLVEFVENGRKLGITVKSKAQGEAVVAHIKANMKKEDPKLICYEPQNPRKIEIKAKGK